MRQQSDLCGHRVKLPPVTTTLTTQTVKGRGNPVLSALSKDTSEFRLLAYFHTRLTLLNAERQAGKL